MHTYCNRSCTHSLDPPKSHSISIFLSIPPLTLPPLSPHPFLSSCVPFPISNYVVFLIQPKIWYMQGVRYMYKVQTDAEEDEATLAQLKGEWELHLCRLERAHLQLKDTALSKSDPNFMLVTFDLQQSLPTPILMTNVVFYKRQFWTYNLGVHDCRSRKGYMYVWHEEGTASQGSSEIDSCILKHIQITNPSETHLITFSDSCGGQNRNIYLLALWLHIVASDQSSFTTIDQKFMVVGHSYLPNDRDFGSIKTATRRASHLYVPTDWSDLITNC